MLMAFQKEQPVKYIAKCTKNITDCIALHSILTVSDLVEEISFWPRN